MSPTPLKEVTSRLPGTDPPDFQAAKNNLPIPFGCALEALAQKLKKGEFPDSS
jgi:hypothetical protein